MNLKNIAKLSLILSLITICLASTCADPPTEPNYKVQNYQGKWYEVAKYQTAGGAYFERNCTCTEINIKKISDTNVNAYQGCIRNGNRVMVNATLIPTSVNGKYTQKIGTNSVGYWVIHMDDQYAVTYDCNTVAGLTNYCIHVLSINPHADLATIQRLAKIALDLGLNKNNLAIQITNQSDSICPRGSFTIQKNLLNSKRLNPIRKD